MTTEKPLTRREMRERERELAARIAAAVEPTAPPAGTGHVVFAGSASEPSVAPAIPHAPQIVFDPILRVPPPVAGQRIPTVFEALAPADVLALEPPSAGSQLPEPEHGNPVTELPVPDAAAPWPAWASKPMPTAESTAGVTAMLSASPAAPSLTAPPLFAPLQTASSLAETATASPTAPAIATAKAPTTPPPPMPSSIASASPAAPPAAAGALPSVADLGPAVPAAGLDLDGDRGGHSEHAAPGTTGAGITRPVVPAQPRTTRPKAITPNFSRLAPVVPGASAPPARLVLPPAGGPSLRRRIVRKVFSTAALLFAGALLVGSSIPANAFRQNSLDDITPVFAQADGGQTVSVSDTDAVPEGSARDADYGVLTYAERLAAKYGETDGNYQPTAGSIRWPFPYSVPTSDGFGPRVSPCAGCSTFHNGLDFLPGVGMPIYAVADGVVSFHAMDGSLGNKVELEHVIKGQAVQSVYAHMQLDSSPLKVGDKVKVGDFIGLVGATGIATAPHLHLEIHLAGVPVNPYTWLTANAK